MQKGWLKIRWRIILLVLMIMLDASYHWADVLGVWGSYVLYPSFPLMGIITYNMFWTTYWTTALIIAMWEYKNVDKRENLQ